MAVTIGEIEVTTAPAPAPASPGQPAASAQGAADVKKEIENTMHRHAERARRLWAY
jgi:hypothetical protein